MDKSKKQEHYMDMKYWRADRKAWAKNIANAIIKAGEEKPKK